MNISSISNVASHLSASQPAQAAQNQKALIQAVKAVNAAELFGEDHELTYLVDQTARIVVVRLIDKETGAVLQQIPSEQVLKMAEESSGR